MSEDQPNPNIKTFPSLDLSNILAPYSNQWVALSPDESKVVAAGMTPIEVIANAQQAGVVDPILTHVPKHHTPHVI